MQIQHAMPKDDAIQPTVMAATVPTPSQPEHFSVLPLVEEVPQVHRGKFRIGAIMTALFVRSNDCVDRPGGS